MKTLAASLTLLSLVCLACAEPAPQSEAAVESSSGQFVFSLRPKSFQRNPLVDATIITEMTPDGKLIPPPTATQPAYYVIQPGGYQSRGEVYANEQPPEPELLSTTMLRTLSSVHYRPATDAHPPNLFLVYHWGSHNVRRLMSRGTVLRRASLIGGVRFAEELRTVLLEQDDYDQARMLTRPEFRADPIVGFEPLSRFRQRDGRTAQLVEQVFEADSYYVVVSAYDYASLTQSRRRLLWRTKMTVDAVGVNMTDTLPGLIVDAGRYFGRDMPVAATIAKRLAPEGRVKLGDLEVKEYLPATGETKPERPVQPPRGNR